MQFVIDVRDALGTAKLLLQHNRITVNREAGFTVDEVYAYLINQAKQDCQFMPPLKENETYSSRGTMGYCIWRIKENENKISVRVLVDPAVLTCHLDNGGVELFDGMPPDQIDPNITFSL